MTFRLTPDHPIVMDGAMGTELIARGMNPREDIAERWVLERADQVSAIHAAYADSGAQVIQTCTFGALRARLEPKGLADRQTEIIRKAIDLARAAAPGRAIVGSLGPSGLVKSSRQAHEVASELVGDYAQAALAMVGQGLVAIHLETQLAPAEIQAAVAGIRQTASELPLWISITVMTGSSGLETPLGVPISTMIQILRECSPDAVGVNCSLDSDRISHAVEQLVAARLGPVIAQPQARISDKCANGISRELPERFAQRAMALFDLGAAAVGGCCGTTPATITALVEAASHIAQQENANAAGPNEVAQ